MDKTLNRVWNVSTTFIINNKFVVINVLMIIIHITIAAWFGIIGVKPMMNINIVSSLIYVVSAIFALNNYKKVTPYVSFVEIIIQAVFAVFFIGWDCGFTQFIIASVPIGIYFMSNDYEHKSNLIISMVMTLFDFLIYVWLRDMSTHIEPVYSLNKTMLDSLFIYAAVCMYGAIIFCCYVYTIENQNITATLKAKNSALKADAQRDPLTGLLNRRGFLPLVKTVYNEGNNFSVAMCDIDNFKRVNDTYGHDAGDAILREVTSIIRKETLGFDVCRWGGEEIVVLFDGLSLDRAIIEMERVRAAVEEHETIFDDNVIKVTITIGVDQHQSSYSTMNDAINVADKRLYYGKHHGKNVVISQDFDDEADNS